MDRLELEYALYKDDTFITCGTLKEISAETGIAIVTLASYASPSYKKKNPNGKQLIKVDFEKLSDQQCERFAFMLKQKRTYEKRPNGLVLTVYADDGHIESRRTFKRLSSEEAKEVKSGYDWDYEYALKHYKYREHYGDYAIWR